MWDCIIVGGGPAGLTAATYLGRFRRDVLLVDAGESRVKRIPMTRNTPGFPDGIAGSELLARLADQASRYGARFREGVIKDIQAKGAGFKLELGDQTLRARTVLLAMGAKLHEPQLPGLDDALRQGLLRYCPICDGYEVRGMRVAVLGGRCGAIAEAHFLRTYSDRVTYFHLADGEPSEAERMQANAAGIGIVNTSLEAIVLDKNVRITDAMGATAEFDVLYPCMGCAPQNELAMKAGVHCGSEGGVVVDRHQSTNVNGIYAAGDVLQGVDQIASACGQAAIAAVAIHNALRELDGAAGSTRRN